MSYRVTPTGWLTTRMQIVRWPNLLLLAGTQGIAFYLADAWHASMWPYILLLIGMTCCAAAGGYVINDICDRIADAHNHERNVMATGLMHDQDAQRFYLWLVIAGALLSVLLATIWSLHMLWIYALMVISLWWYSKQLKHLPLAGNVAVSMFCSGAILVAWWPLPGTFPPPDDLVWLAVFAGLVTHCREVVKDLEDITGDRIAGSHTLPVIAGVQVTTVLAVLFHVIAIAAFILYWTSYKTDPGLLFTLMGILSAGLLAIAAILLVMAKGDKHRYHKVSLLIKIAMLTGACAIVL